jgi:hypothetical protein
VESGFYHTECALKMSDSNREEVSRVLGNTQDKLKAVKEETAFLRDLLIGQNELIKRLLAESN